MSCKNAVIVGGTGQVGASLATRLEEDGWRVVIVSRRPGKFNPPTDTSPARMVHRANASDEDQVQDCFRTLTASLGSIGALIYTAGREADVETPLANYPTVAWHSTIDTYLTGFFVCFREALNVMQPGGHIIAISSAVTRLTEATRPPLLFAGHYAAAKAGLDELCKWARREAHQRGILLSRLAPGAIDTPFHRNAPAHRRPVAMLAMSAVVDRIIAALSDATEIDELLIAK